MANEEATVKWFPSHERILLICLFISKFMNAISSWLLPNDSLHIKYIAENAYAKLSCDVYAIHT